MDYKVVFVSASPPQIIWPIRIRMQSGVGVGWVELNFARPKPDLSKKLRPKSDMYSLHLIED